MDIHKAIELHKAFKAGLAGLTDKACDFTIAALEEFNEYRQIGTVDECKAAMDRQAAKEPQFHISEFQCPNCGMEHLEEIDDLGHIYLRHKYCPDCGQALKWGK